jgi:hypothetical protein
VWPWPPASGFATAAGDAAFATATGLASGLATGTGGAAGAPSIFVASTFATDGVAGLGSAGVASGLAAGVGGAAGTTSIGLASAFVGAAGGVDGGRNRSRSARAGRAGVSPFSAGGAGGNEIATVTGLTFAAGAGGLPAGSMTTARPSGASLTV